MIDSQSYPCILSSHCKDSLIKTVAYSIVTHFVNFKHNFHKESNRNFFQK